MRKDSYPIFLPSSLPHSRCVHAAKEKELGGINKWDTPLNDYEVHPSVMETLSLVAGNIYAFHQNNKICQSMAPHNPTWRTRELVRLSQQGSEVAHRRAANPNSAVPPECLVLASMMPSQQMQS